MKYQAGDRVRFLNEAVEGIVSKILSNQRVEVTDSDGFTHIAEEKYLVPVEFVPGDQQLDEQAQPELKNTAAMPRKKSDRESLLKHLEDDFTIYAIVRLLNPAEPFTTDVEISLANNTTYLIGYSIAKRFDDMRIGIHADILSKKEAHPIGIFSQDELYRFNGFEIQFLFTGEGEFRPRPPAVKILQFNSTDFLNPEFKHARPDFNDVLLMPLYSFSIERDIDIKGLIEKYNEFNKEEEKRTPPKGGKKIPFTILTRHRVVDLHIEQLMKDYSAMSNAQIISYQLNYFIYEMEQAILQKLHKITFIHGVGQGILKNAIREELKKYNGINFYEAPPEKYGYGATEVEFL